MQHSFDFARSLGQQPLVAEDVDEREEEQPNHVNKVPIPGGTFKPEVALWCEVASHCTEQANQQEDSPDYHVKAVKARRHKERRTIDAATGESEHTEM